MGKPMCLIDNNYIGENHKGMAIPRKGWFYKLKNSLLFPCYSIPLRDFLISKGFKYELVGLHPKTNNMFWIFIKDKALNNALDEWNKN